MRYSVYAVNAITVMAALASAVVIPPLMRMLLRNDPINTGLVHAKGEKRRMVIGICKRMGVKRSKSVTVLEDTGSRIKPTEARLIQPNIIVLPAVCTENEGAIASVVSKMHNGDAYTAALLYAGTTTLCSWLAHNIRDTYVHTLLLVGLCAFSYQYESYVERRIRSDIARMHARKRRETME